METIVDQATPLFFMPNHNEVREEADQNGSLEVFTVGRVVDIVYLDADSDILGHIPRN